MAILIAPVTLQDKSTMANEVSVCVAFQLYGVVRALVANETTTVPCTNAAVERSVGQCGRQVDWPRLHCVLLG